MGGAAEGGRGPRPGPRLVLLGPPGSGKGTQAELLAAELGIPAISTGEMLRRAVDEGSPLGRRVHEIMVSGELVDDATMAEVVERRLDQGDAAGGFLLDGYPRTIAQADNLDAILGRQSVALDAVLHIQVPEEELVQRVLARRRADDREEVVRARLEVYKEKTEPLVGHYERRGLLREIDGHQPIEAVLATILAALSVVR